MRNLFSFIIICSLAAISCTKTKVADPILTLTSEENVIVPEEGGDITITYTLENKIEGEELIVNINTPEWISVSENNLDGNIVITVDPTDSKEDRTSSIFVSYADKTSFTVNLTQSKYTIKVEAKHLMGDYYGNEFSPDPNTGNFWLILSENGLNEDGAQCPNSTYYKFDVYTPLSDIEYGEADLIPVPEGVYHFDSSNSFENGTVSNQYSTAWTTDANGAVSSTDATVHYEDCTLTITANSIVAQVVIRGETHTITYNGTPEVADARTNPFLSDLNDDYQMNFENCSLILYPVGDYYGIGYQNIMLYLTPDNGIGDHLTLDMVTNFATLEEGIAGTYGPISISEAIAPGTFLSGFASEDGYAQGSWWYYSATGEPYVYDKMAPFISGNIEISENQDGTITINVDTKDDRDNNITGTWTGTYETYSGMSARNAIPFNHFQQRNLQNFEKR